MLKMLEFCPNELDTKTLHQYLLSGIGPRPIALASTIDQNGNKNLSPFSFFNIFSAKPPIAIFSPARRVRNNTTKDTLENIKKIKEVVINIVNYKLTEQTSLTSCEYPKKVDEFIKSGLTAIKSKKIRPFRVQESPIQMECKVNQIIELGKNGGAGNLVICEIILIHIKKYILKKNNTIDPEKLQLVGRMGGDLYCKGFGQSLFTIQKPSEKLAIGFDQLPNSVKNSHIFSNNDLVKLASIGELPNKNEIKAWKEKYYSELSNNSDNKRNELYIKAKKLIEKNDIYNAWKFLLIIN